MHLFKLNEKENETATMSNYLHLFALHVTKKFSLNMLKTISLKIEKKTSIEEQSEGHALVDKTSEATQPTDEKESKRSSVGSERFRCMVKVIPSI